MAYIENVVIGTPIVDPKDMFVSDEDDWTRMEEEEIMESVSEKERDETEQEDRTNENSFFERTDDSYAIYQYDNTDGNWGYKFMGLSIISNMGLSVDGKDYRMMFMEQLHEHDSLDELYHRFNAERPEGFDGHSLSVSDVVIMKRNGEMKAYYVDDVGFSELPEFTKQREQIIDRSNDSPVYAGTLEQTEAQKSTDMFNKCQYMNEITEGSGITFATGTPISNSMTELFTIQRYLQMEELQKTGLTQFDAWAATFGETVTAIELAPEGTGYRTKTRFSRFFNVPELMSMFKEVADIKTSDQLNLPVPEVEYKTIVIKPTEEQKEYVAELGERAEQVRNGGVDSSIDNMLKITNDGRKLALDQRLVSDAFPDSVDGKVSECARQCYDIWENTKDTKSAQLVFCDLSTPKNDGTFNVYDDLKQKLMDMGVPEEEIAYIHHANTDTRKAELFSKVRSGQVRFLFGSTAKMGAGTNVQDRLIALHHLDVPWKPSDIEQQEGRILRQGNQNEKVQIFRYVTEGTFDSYMWQLLENKQKFVGQIMTSKSPVRSCEDVDEAVLSFAEIKALATGNPYIKEKMELDIEVAKLKVLKANHNANRYRLENQIVHDYPLKISNEKVRIQQLQEDLKCYQSYQIKNQDRFEMIIENVTFDDKELAGKAIRTAAKKENRLGESGEIGTYQGFTMFVSYNHISNSYNLKLQNQRSYLIELGENGLGNIIRINNALDNIPKHIARAKQNLQTYESQLEDAKIEVMKEFPKEADLKEKTDRLSELNALLNMDQSNHEIVAEEQIEEQETAEVTNKTQKNEVVPKFGTR